MSRKSKTFLFVLAVLVVTGSFAYLLAFANTPSRPGVPIAPNYPGAREVNQLNGGPFHGHVITFITQDSSEQVRAFYSRTLEGAGWNYDECGQWFYLTYGPRRGQQYIRVNTSSVSTGLTKVTVDSFAGKLAADCIP